MMQNKQFRHQKPLCKFINYCPDFMNRGMCQFNHDKCSYGLKCKTPQTCKFYHPQVNFKSDHYSNTMNRSVPRNNTSVGKNFDKPISQVACKFGKKCNKPGCKFNHDITPAKQTKEIMIEQKDGRKICPYGQSCKFYKQNKCRNFHPENNNQNQIRNNNKPQSTNFNSNQNYKPQSKFNQSGGIKSGPEIHNPIKEFQQNRLCKEYAVGSCKNPNCSQTHNFSFGNSLKRVFYQSGGNRTKDNTKVNYGIVRLKNQSFLAFTTQHNQISILQINSEFNMLRNVCTNDHLIPSGSISNIFIRSKKIPGSSEQFCDQIIITASDQKIYSSDLIAGKITKSSLQNSSKIFACQYLMTQSGVYRILAFTGIGITIEKTDNKTIGNPQKFLTEENKNILRGIVAMKKIKILEKDVIVFACGNGDILIMRSDFQSRRLRMTGGSDSVPVIIKDIACSVLGGGIGYAFITAISTNKRKSYLIALSLASLTSATVLSFPSDNNRQISKIVNVEKNIFVGVNGVGVLLFEAPSFQTPIARIPISQQSIIGDLYSDGDSTIILSEQHSMDTSNGSFSIYKVKKS